MACTASYSIKYLRTFCMQKQYYVIIITFVKHAKLIIMFFGLHYALRFECKASFKIIISQHDYKYVPNIRSIGRKGVKFQ